MAWQAIEMSDEELAEVDRWIYRLARGRGRLRLRIGQALAMNGEAQHHDYGFSTFEAYTLERLSVTGRWAADTRALARRLEELPRIRAALDEGRIGWCMAEVLARDATPEDESDLLDHAERASIRSMRAWLRARRGGPKKIAEVENAERGEDGRALTAPEVLAADPRARELGIVIEDLGVVVSDGGEVEDDPFHMLAITAPAEEHWHLEATRLAVEYVTGSTSAGGWVDPLLGEGLSAILPWFPGRDPISDEVRAKQDAFRKLRAANEESRARAEMIAEPAILALREREAGDAPGDDDPIPDDPWVRERRLRQWCAELTSRDLWLGKHLSRFFAADGWRRLGYASETQYAQERLGMSRASMRKHMRLARQTDHLERLHRAVVNGEIGCEAALLLTRIVEPDTEGAWVARAKKRTFKHLREEVIASETLARMSRVDVGDMTPPTDEEMEAWFRLEREAVTGSAFKRAIERMTGGSDESAEVVQMSGSVEGASTSDSVVQMSGSAASEAALVGSVVQMSGSVGEASSSDVVQMSGSEASSSIAANRHRGTITRYWPVRESTLLFWRQLEDAHRRSQMEMSFLTFLCCAFWAAWGPSIGKPQDGVWQHIYDRDRRQCTSPVCMQRHRIENHHLIFRSHGGGDEPENNGAACGFCHRPGVHEGRLKVFPPASKMRWLIGMRPLIEVVGRDKRELC